MMNIIERIEKAKHIVVIAHKNPDADSFGSASAFYTYLLQLHKKVSFFCKTKDISPKLLFLPWSDKVRDGFPKSADLVVSLDCGSKNRLGIEFECDLINIDHHESNSHFGTYNLVDSSCISTTHVLSNFFLEHNIKINKKMATALYAGLLDDSNGFMSSEVDGTVFALQHMLIESGADYTICNHFLMNYISLAALRLKGLMFTNMQLTHNATIALFHVYNKDMKQTGAMGEDCEYALEEALYLPTVKVSILLKENKDLSVKVSLRSSSERLDMSRIASHFGGGGHKIRSGCTFSKEYTLQKASQELLQHIKKELKFGTEKI